MEANFDLLVSGCNTRCRHCYVHGGPGPDMPLEDVLNCIGRLDALASFLPFHCSFTLDNEPMKHPEPGKIIRAAAETGFIRYFHHGMTTGIALMERKDRAEVMQAYLDSGYHDFGITLHGNAAHHDEIVRRKGAFEKSLEAAGFMKDCGAKINVSLMFNCFFEEDADGIMQALDRLRPDFVYFTIPNYTPHGAMDAFEPFRGRSRTLEAFIPRLELWGKEQRLILDEAEGRTIGAAVRALENGLELKALFRRLQEELYLTVHQDCRMFIGNTGAETECLGDLRTIDLRKTADCLIKQPGNRDYGAFFDPDALPEQEILICALKEYPQDLLYSDTASVIHRGLAALRVPARIIPVRASSLIYS